MSGSRLKILFSGMAAGDPHQGGATWAVLQYVLGLQELGHDVRLIEPVAEQSLRLGGRSMLEAEAASYFCAVMDDFNLTKHSTLLVEGTRDVVGLSYEAVADFAREADLLINVSGMLTDRALTERIPIRAYLDLDPAFNQIWHALEGIDMRLADHTHYVTVGLAFGSPECRAPRCGRRWITTLQPVVLSQWPVGDAITCDAFTTVGNWRGYGSVHLEGVFYGQKAHSLRELMDLPRRTQERFMLAMAIHPDESKDLQALHECQWQLVDPRKVADTPRKYQRFVRESKAEFGIAKSGYVKSRCGWFSDRSACYLAAGRPVVAQDTGFSRYLPTGEGLLPFNTIDDAVDAIDSVNREYERHSQAARRLAETHFASEVVLSRLLERLGLAE
jgi:hypothetical protein